MSYIDEVEIRQYPKKDKKTSTQYTQKTNNFGTQIKRKARVLRIG